MIFKINLQILSNKDLIMIKMKNIVVRSWFAKIFRFPRKRRFSINNLNIFHHLGQTLFPCSSLKYILIRLNANRNPWFVVWSCVPHRHRRISPFPHLLKVLLCCEQESWRNKGILPCPSSTCGSACDSLPIQPCWGPSTHLQGPLCKQ